MAAPKKPSSLRDRLREKQRPTASYPIQIDDARSAHEDLEEAQRAHGRALLIADDENVHEVQETKKRLAKAQAAYDACHENVTIRALRPEDFEALVAAHPIDRSDKDQADSAWNPNTFPRALFHECVDSDLTREEWDDFLDNQCSQAERVGLFHTALEVNVRTPDEMVPKDSMRSRL